MLSLPVCDIELALVCIRATISHSQDTPPTVTVLGLKLVLESLAPDTITT